MRTSNIIVNGISEMSEMAHVEGEIFGSQGRLMTDQMQELA
jgi:acyl-CoA thioesterase